MTSKLTPEARRDLRTYVLHVAGATDATAARRENARARDTLAVFAAASAAGRDAEIPGWPRPLRRHDLHPFHAFYERREGVLVVVRLYHHARRPLGT